MPPKKAKKGKKGGDDDEEFWSVASGDQVLDLPPKDSTDSSRAAKEAALASPAPEPEAEEEEGGGGLMVGASIPESNPIVPNN
jgi:hypothetical protein